MLIEIRTNDGRVFVVEKENVDLIKEIIRRRGYWVVSEKPIEPDRWFSEQDPCN